LGFHWTLGFGDWDFLPDPRVGNIVQTMAPRSIIVHNCSLTIRRAEAAEVIDLRHRVLRFGLAREEAIFPGDDSPTSRHFGAFDNTTAICCATFHKANYETEPGWRLRGMATDERFRSRGLGRELLNYAEETLLGEDPIRLFWCNARIGALKFYQSQGWEIVSDLFDIPTAGLHYQMVKRI